MANGLFSRNATVMGPEQAMANVGRSLGRAFGEPALGLMGRQSEEQAVMNVMKDVNPTDLSSVKEGFMKIMTISPAAADEYRKQMMPFVTSQQEQIGKEASLLKALGQGKPESKEIYDRVLKEYKTTFCQGGLIGKECAIPSTRPELGAKYGGQVPTLEEFFASKGKNKYAVYQEMAGNTDPVTGEFTSQPAKSNMTDDEIATKFDIPKDNKELLKLVRQDVDNNVPEANIIAKLTDANKQLSGVDSTTTKKDKPFVDEYINEPSSEVLKYLADSGLTLGEYITSGGAQRDILGESASNFLDKYINKPVMDLFK